MNKRYVVRLDAEERQQLEQLVKVGKVAGHKIRHANMLLMGDVNGPAIGTAHGSRLWSQLTLPPETSPCRI